MCGIAGIFDPNRTEASSEATRGRLESMAQALSHRGPDDQGFFLARHVGLAHTRLAIIDLSDGGHQPMQLENLAITYNGEIYNYRELREELRSLGRTFRTKSDTEVLLHAYQEWGPGCLNRFNGMWAFAILNVDTGSLFCARDRFGIKPLYYAEVSGSGSGSGPRSLIFASEIKALQAAGVGTKADDTTVATYLVTGLTDHSERTFFSEVRQLPPSHTLTVSPRSGVRIERYYDLTATVRAAGANATETPAAQYEAHLGEAVALRLRSDVRVGTCLSGGLDSSTVAALAARANRASNGERFHAVTASSEQNENDETRYAELVARHCDLEWSVVRPEYPQFATQIEACLRQQDEPVGGPSIFMQYAVLERAKELGIKVMLDGQGGDETLLGYERYYPFYFRALAARGKLWRASKEFLLAGRRSRLSFRRLAAYSAYFSSTRLRRRVLRRRASFLTDDAFREATVHLADVGGRSELGDMQAGELERWQLPHLLRYEDRNSMAHSIEARVPFLDHRCVETALVLPPSEKIRDGYTKYCLRRFAAELLPKEIAWRREKFGFEAPERLWMERHAKNIEDAIRRSVLLRRFCRTPPQLEALPLRSRWFLYNVALWERVCDVR